MPAVGHITRADEESKDRSSRSCMLNLVSGGGSMYHQPVCCSVTRAVLVGSSTQWEEPFLSDSGQHDERMTGQQGPRPSPDPRRCPGSAVRGCAQRAAFSSSDTVVAASCGSFAGHQSGVPTGG
jgi:hypothetical protein